MGLQNNDFDILENLRVERFLRYYRPWSSEKAVWASGQAWPGSAHKLADPGLAACVSGPPFPVSKMRDLQHICLHLSPYQY